MDKLTSLRVFCQVAELKSFAAAAERLQMSPAMVSKHIMQLETRLSTRLLNRTSRSVSLTESGALYFERTQQILDALEDADAMAGKATALPRGTLRISAPVWCANGLFAAVLAAYHSKYPDVVLDVDLSGRLVNLVDEGIDMALRVSGAPGDALIARPLIPISMQLVAAPDYLVRCGRPGTVAELSGHDFLRYALFPGKNILLSGPEGQMSVSFKQVLISANETLLHQAAVAGMGMALLPTWLTAQDLAAGRLELVLPETMTVKTSLLAVYSSRKHLSAKVRTFIDFVAAHPLLKPTADPTQPLTDVLATHPQRTESGFASWKLDLPAMHWE